MKASRYGFGRFCNVCLDRVRVLAFGLCCDKHMPAHRTQLHWAVRVCECRQYRVCSQLGEL